ncbi:delta(12) fatty acid desaturase-like protein, partial [Tanacetum coccineum]
MTPYFSFQYSHRSHHAHTNSLEYDEVYIPKRKSDTFFTEFLNNGPGNVFTLLIRITIGYPLSLIFNVYGRDYKQFTNHFLPQSGIFNDSERGYVVLSDIGIITVLYALYHLAVAQGGKSTLFLFVTPLFTEGGFFILSTYLRGALSTIDRDFGILNWIQHDINSSRHSPFVPKHASLSRCRGYKSCEAYIRGGEEKGMKTKKCRTRKDRKRSEVSAIFVNPPKQDFK